MRRFRTLRGSYKAQIKREETVRLEGEPDYDEIAHWACSEAEGCLGTRMDGLLDEAHAVARQDKTTPPTVAETGSKKR